MIRKIVVLGLVLIIFLGLFVGCARKPSNIVARAMFSKNTLKLPIIGQQPNAPGEYFIDKTIDEIFSLISLDKSLSAELIEEQIFISRDNEDGTKDYFLIREIAVIEGKIMYLFFDMGGQLKLNNSFGQRILVPYHLFTRDDDYFASYIEMDTQFRTIYEIDDFFDFYNNSGWYDVEKGEDYFILKGYKDAEKVIELNNTLRYPLKGMDFGIAKKYQFISSKESDENIFVISYQLEK